MSTVFTVVLAPDGSVGLIVTTMNRKPGLPLFLAWLIAYLILDLLFEYAFRGRLTWSQLPASLGEAIFAALVTWLFAFRKWSNSGSLD
jgi:energy-coupling factor transporter transmembrane protein EcfT